MNEISPPHASAAPAPTAEPPLAETLARVEAETPPGPSPAPETAAPREAASVSTTDPFALPLVSQSDPCGLDLDLEGDADFLSFVAATEGMLPASYYAFNRAGIDFPAALQAAEALLKRTLDMRLLALMAKLSILNRDLAGFAQRVGNIAWLVKEHWEAASPKADGADYSGRIAQLMTLEDNAVVLLPLQYAPLIETNREGALSYRDQMLATGATQPRSVTLYDLKGEKRTTEPEKFMAPNSIARALSDVEIGKLAGAVETLKNLGASIQSIKAVTTEHVGYENGVELPKLAKLVVRDDAVPARGAHQARPVARPRGRRASRGRGHCSRRSRRGAGRVRIARRG